MPTLSAVFLTRNEEADIARAVRSVRGVADQILVVDTHSTDRTAAIAAAEGAEVVLHDWADDFAAARHFALAHARGDWVLIINADEELLTRAPGTWRECLARDGTFGYWVALRGAAPGTDQAAETSDVRLFRRRPDVQFIGRIHPRFDEAFVSALAAERLLVHGSSIVLQSHADFGPMPESKLRFIERLLSLELRDRPGQLSHLIEHGRTLILLGDPRGHGVLAQAERQMLAHFGEPTAPSHKVQVLLEYLLTVPSVQAHTRLGREGARELALRWFPNSPALLWAMAGEDFAGGDYPRAAELLEHLVMLGETKTYDRSARFDPKLVGEQARMNLGACYLEMGRLDAAAACFERLRESPTLGAGAAHNLALVASRRAAMGRS
jgi:hypothetical protein